MKWLLKIKKCTLICLIGILSIACTNEIDIDTLNPPTPIDTLLSDCTPGRAYFYNDVMPIIESHCAIPGCHDASTPAGQINLATYENIMSATIKGELIVKPGQRNNSILYQAVMPQYLLFMPPSRSHQLTPKMRNDIGLWIQQGAVKDICKTECDEKQPLFNTTVRPIIFKYCTGCHYDKFPQGDIELHSYATIKAVAESGDLIKSMRGLDGVATMPPGNLVPECEIQLVEQWIARGMLRD